MILHQFSEAAVRGDALTDHALHIRRWLRSAGYDSDIFANHYRENMASEVRPASSYRRRHREKALIYHHSTGADMVDRLAALDVPIILIYHNVTPSSFFQRFDPAASRQLAGGREQLLSLRNQTILALGVSSFNELELKECGFENTGVLPIVLDTRLYDIDPDPGVLASLDDGRANLLFLGRLAPNKKQEDLIKLLYYYQRINSESRAILVGSDHIRSYSRWLGDFAKELNLQDSVVFSGHVSQAEMIAFYKVADVYVSMSEHEGFGKPLIESMYLDLPVLAFAEAAVPLTLGNSGVHFRDKHYEGLAEVVDILVNDEALRQRIIQGQKKRVQEFLGPQVRDRFYGYLDALDLGLQAS